MPPASDPKAHYPALWGTLLAEVDETLLVYKSIVHDIADKLMRRGTVRSRKLTALLSKVAKRNAPPPLRAEVSLIAHDPLA